MIQPHHDIPMTGKIIAKPRIEFDVCSIPRGENDHRIGTLPAYECRILDAVRPDKWQPRHLGSTNLATGPQPRCDRLKIREVRGLCSSTRLCRIPDFCDNLPHI